MRTVILILAICVHDIAHAIKKDEGCDKAALSFLFVTLLVCMMMDITDFVRSVQ